MRNLKPIVNLMLSAVMQKQFGFVNDVIEVLLDETGTKVLNETCKMRT